MIDRHKRETAAATIRDFIDGKITNDQFMRLFPRSADDPALPAVLKAVWMQFSDHRVHKLSGRDNPTPELRSVLERCWLFLNGNRIPMATSEVSRRQRTAPVDWLGRTITRL